MLRPGNLGRVRAFRKSPDFGPVRDVAMVFFRTKESQGDRSLDQGARAQRRQQQQMQLQMLEREKAAAAAPAAQPAL